MTCIKRKLEKSIEVELSQFLLLSIFISSHLLYINVFFNQTSVSRLFDVDTTDFISTSGGQNKPEVREKLFVLHSYTIFQF